MASRITTTSTNTGDTITTNRETTTSSSTTSTTKTTTKITTTSSSTSATTSTTTTSETSTTTSTTLTTTSSTSSILRQLPQLVKPVLPRVLQVLLLRLVLPQVPRALLPQLLQVLLPQVPRALLPQLVLPRVPQVLLPRLVLLRVPQVLLPQVPRALLPQLVLPRVPQVLLPRLVLLRVLQAVLVQAQQLRLFRVPQVPLPQLVKLVLPQLLQVQLPQLLQVPLLQLVLLRVLQVLLPQLVLLRVPQLLLPQLLRAVLVQVPQLLLPQLLQAVQVQVQQQQQIHVSISGNLLWNKTGITVLGSVAAPVPASGVFLDSNDTLYAADEAGHYVVWKLLKNAINATIVAGSYGSIGSNSSQLYFPNDVYVDRSGNMYVTDMGNSRVQKFINKSTNAITFAGSANGSAGSALNQMNAPHYFTFDPTETYMYVADTGNHRIVRYLTNSTSGTNGVLVAGGVGGSNTNTSLNGPWGIHYLPSVSNDLFITNYNGHSVIRWTPGALSGSVIAGVPGVSGSDSTHLNSPMGIKIDNYMNVYVVDFGNSRVQLFCANSNVGFTIAGNGTAGSGATQLNSPRGIAFDSAMNMYIGDDVNNRVQKFMKL
ncbi:unnamed protein product [Adineta steineri]|uniref:SMP-30/Gluconolactonase/LRE-like region domain-containing protein n=1 Tax=Adineta steineri TaxID=433720 RepID=A0A814ZF55_9BILA|nr:unnamed protein product [Adineta steineri]CAF1242760.1 unnamed protein product [Adineta steineri]